MDWKCRLPKSSRRSKLSSALATGMRPLAPSLWPVLDLTEPRGSCGDAPSKTAARPSSSSRSPTKVPVPCASTKATAEAGRPQAEKARRVGRLLDAGGVGDAVALGSVAAHGGGQQSRVAPETREGRGALEHYDHDGLRAAVAVGTLVEAVARAVRREHVEGVEDGVLVGVQRHGGPGHEGAVDVARSRATSKEEQAP